MQILLTNDDGIFSPGLTALATALRSLGEVEIVAPSSEQSGVGQSISFKTPLITREVPRPQGRWGWAVDGSPVDCVKLGVDQLCTERPDLIVSGMNNGLNVGANSLYSGTIAAALEGAIHGIPSIAVSLQYTEKSPDPRIEWGARVAVEVIRSLLKEPFSPGLLYNLNIPFSALESPSPEVAVVPMDRTRYWQHYEMRTDPVGRRYFWLVDRPDDKKIEEGNHDFGRVSHGKITLTPLNFNMTDRSEIDRLRGKEWNLSLDSPPQSDDSDPFDLLYRAGIR